MTDRTKKFIPYITLIITILTILFGVFGSYFEMRFRLSIIEQSLIEQRAMIQSMISSVNANVEKEIMERDKRDAAICSRIEYLERILIIKNRAIR